MGFLSLLADPAFWKALPQLITLALSFFKHAKQNSDQPGEFIGKSAEFLNKSLGSKTDQEKQDALSSLGDLIAKSGS